MSHNDQHSGPTMCQNLIAELTKAHVFLRICVENVVANSLLEARKGAV